MGQKTNLALEKNKDQNKILVSELHQKVTQIKLGGGKAKLEKIRSEGKMTARERINYLMDHNSKSIEIGALAGYNMYHEEGGCPSGGVVVVMGYVGGKLCVIVANDASVKAGSWFPISAKKNLRAQEIALENRIPIIYLVDSAGVFLTRQNEIFTDK